MSLEKVLINVKNKDMVKGNKIIEEHKGILEVLQKVYNKTVYINYSNGECAGLNRSSDAIFVNMWSALPDTDMVFPEKDTAFENKFCTDGIFVPNEEFITFGEDLPLIQYKDNNFYFLYDVCEFGTDEELALMSILIEGILIKLEGSKEAIDAKIAECERIENAKRTKAFINRMSERERENKEIRRRDLEEKKRKMAEARQTVRNLVTQIIVDEKMLSSNTDAFAELEITLNKELEIMANNKMIKKVEIDEQGLIIAHTEMIYSNVLGKDNKVRRYRFGEYQLKIDVSNGEVKFINANNKDKRHSCWGDKCHHPHVNEQGNACLGSASTLIMDCVDRYQWGVLADVLINYLQSVNIDDSAGKYYIRWDEVDNDGKKKANQFDGCY